MSTNGKNLYQRMNEVRKAVKYIKKDAKVQNYSAVTHDNVTAVLRPHLVEHGIMVLVDQKAGRIIEPRNPEKGVRMHLYQGDYSVILVNIDNPEDRLAVNVQAHANDNGDKAPGKSLSYATKSALLKLFGLETGQSDESRVPDAEDLTDITEALNACEDMEGLQATFQMAWHSYPNSRKELTAIKDAKKKELRDAPAAK